MTGFLGEEFKVRSYGSDINVIFSRITALNPQELVQCASYMVLVTFETFSS